MEDVKMFLFARWLATSYADSHLDENMKSENDIEFDGSNAMSVLNRESGYWYRENLRFFNDVVYPNMEANGSVEDARKFLTEECKHDETHDV